MQMVYNPELLQTGKCDVLPVCTFVPPLSYCPALSMIIEPNISKTDTSGRWNLWQGDGYILDCG